MNLEEPADATTQTSGPSLPSLDLLPRLSQKMTILLMGVDSNGINTDPFLGTRSDTMMLVSIDPTARKVGVVSIPRDSRVRIPNHGLDKINSAHAIGGAELAAQTVREAFGVPVDHYVEVDTGGLKKLFEILGPVEVLVEKEMHYVDHTAKLNVDLQPGLQQLSPEQTEQYVRFRHDARGDIGRIERQQWFVRQAAKKFKEPQIVLKLPQLVSLAYQCVRTDLPVQDVLSIAAYAREFPQEKVVTAMLPGDARWIGGGSYWVPDSAAGQVMFSRILGCSTTASLSAVASPAATASPAAAASTSVAASPAAVASSSVPASPAATALPAVAALPTGTASPTASASPTGTASPAASASPSAGSVPSTAAVQSGAAPSFASSSADVSMSVTSPGLTCDGTKPATVAIKYPGGCEQLSLALADQLTQAGFKVKYRWQIADSDCRHELLVQQSMRANDEATSKIYQSVPEIQNFPLSLALEARPSTDFTIIVTPESQMPSICRSLLPAPVLQQKAPPLNVNAGAIPLMPQE